MYLLINQANQTFISVSGISALGSRFTREKKLKYMWHCRRGNTLESHSLFVRKICQTTTGYHQHFRISFQRQEHRL